MSPALGALRLCSTRYWTLIINDLRRMAVRANRVNRSLDEHGIPTNHCCGLYSTVGRNYDS